MSSMNLWPLIKLLPNCLAVINVNKTLFCVEVNIFTSLLSYPYIAILGRLQSWMWLHWRHNSVRKLPFNSLLRKLYYTPDIKGFSKPSSQHVDNSCICIWRTYKVALKATKTYAHLTVDEKTLNVYSNPHWVDSWGHILSAARSDLLRDVFHAFPESIADKVTD